MDMVKKYKKEKMVVDGKVYFPRIANQKNQLTQKPSSNINYKSLPVGRVSTDSVSFSDLIKEFSLETNSMSAAFPLEYLEAIQNLSLINPDIAQMIDNIVQLGNSGHQIIIETKNERTKELALEEINSFNSNVFYRYGGIDGFINSTLAQIARAGAISIEWVVDKSLNGLEKVVFVPIKQIRFIYKKDFQDYFAFQKTNNLNLGENGLIELNPLTHQYCALQTLDNSPYAIPPILAALESVMIQREIIKNLKFISKKMGLLGFVNFLVKAPRQAPGEKTEEYIARCQTFLDDQAARLKDNYRDGIAVGFMDSFSVEHHAITGGVQGAKDLFEMNEQQVFSGLKADPAMHGRTYSTTETYAGVVYEKMMSVLANYQRIVKTVLEYGYKLHLNLLGLDYQNLWVEFEPAKSLSSERDERVYGNKLDNLIKLYDQGIIDQNQLASEAGYETPAESEPRKNEFVFFKDQKASENKLVLQFNKQSGRYQSNQRNKPLSLSEINDSDFRSSHSSCCGSKNHQTESFILDEAQEKNLKFQEEYFKKIYPTLKKSRNQSLKAVKKFIEEFDFVAGDSELFSSNLLEIMGASFAHSVAKSKLNKLVLDQVTMIYLYFRLQDTQPFGGEFPVKPKFNLVDQKAIDFLNRSDNFYFGRYLTNDQTKKELKNWLVKEYLRSGQNLRDSGELAKFRKLFENRVAKEDYKILRIVETTTNRARNWGNIFSVQESNAASLEITGPLDRVSCLWCKSMVGKKFKVDSVVDHVKHVMDQEPEKLPQLNPFLPNQMHPKIAKALTGDELLTRGISLPPYHPHCRHGYVVDKFK